MAEKKGWIEEGSFGKTSTFNAADEGPEGVKAK